MSNEIGSGLKILILDDEKDIANFTKEYFEQRGFEVFSTLKGKAAISIAKKQKPDIALLDIHLSSKEAMSGIDVLKAIREVNPDCYCIMVTRDDQETMEEEARNLGAFDYLTKLSTAKNLDKIMLKAVKKLRKEGK